MSKDSAQIIEAIQRISGTFGKEIIQVIDTIVTSDVDEDKLTIDTEVIKGVLLSPVPNDGLVLYPSKGSTVKIAYSTKTTAFLLQASDLEKARITIGLCEYFIDKDGIKLHGDNLGGLVIAQVTAAKIAALETFCNTVASALGITPPPFSATTTAIELQNIKVQHGNS